MGCFFFQAEDGIRDDLVTGVQTCALPIFTIVAAAGATLSASVSAGQTAQFNLQATPAAGFSGTLAFACSGMPMGTTCSAPNGTVTNGAAVNFTVAVATSGSAMVAPMDRRTIRLRAADYAAAAMLLVLLLMLLPFWFYWRKRAWRAVSASAIDWKRAAALACLALMVNGCGGGSSGSSVQPPPPPPAGLKPSGNHMLTSTPSPTPAGFPKKLSISPVSFNL